MYANPRGLSSKGRRRKFSSFGKLYTASNKLLELGIVGSTLTSNRWASYGAQLSLQSIENTVEALTFYFCVYT